MFRQTSANVLFLALLPLVIVLYLIFALGDLLLQRMEPPHLPEDEEEPAPLPLLEEEKPAPKYMTRARTREVEAEFQRRHGGGVAAA